MHPKLLGLIVLVVLILIFRFNKGFGNLEGFFNVDFICRYLCCVVFDLSVLR